MLQKTVFFYPANFAREQRIFRAEDKNAHVATISTITLLFGVAPSKEPSKVVSPQRKSWFPVVVLGANGIVQQIHDNFFSLDTSRFAFRAGPRTHSKPPGTGSPRRCQGRTGPYRPRVVAAPHLQNIIEENKRTKRSAIKQAKRYNYKGIRMTGFSLLIAPPSRMCTKNASLLPSSSTYTCTSYSVARETESGSPSRPQRGGFTTRHDCPLALT